MGKKMKRYRKCGSTLVELLVVLCALVILAAMSLPILSETKDNLTDSEICINNLRQCYQAIVMYAQDYDGYLVQNQWPAGWTGVAGTNSWGEMLYRKTSYIKDYQVLRCPSQLQVQGSDETGIGAPGVTMYTYGSFQRKEAAVKLNKVETYQALYTKGLWPDDLASYILLIDSVRGDQGVQAFMGDASHNINSIHCRHDKKANALMADGRVISLSKAELISLNENTMAYTYGGIRAPANPEFVIEGAWSKR